MKTIGIFGSTGSIGKQTLEVIAAQKNRFTIKFLTAQSNIELLLAQAFVWHPEAVCIRDEKYYQKVKNALAGTSIQVFCGEKGLLALAQWPDTELVLTAVVGFAGLASTIAAIEHGKHVALANKETLVVAGEIITQLSHKNKVHLLPVDSEHSAIFQCLCGETMESVEKVILTASGGPFRGKDPTYLANVSKHQALKHPNWTMGQKITIDSATLMNKGLEVIEAKWLFQLKPEQIDVVIHPQSIIHSMVSFNDGSIKAQMGWPDMKLPIQYALGWPERLHNQLPRFDFGQVPHLDFEEADRSTFKNLDLAFFAMQQGGNAPCILNAANEIAVSSFLADKLSFLQMSDVIEHCLQKVTYIPSPILADYFETDKETRSIAVEFISKLNYINNKYI